MRPEKGDTIQSLVGCGGNHRLTQLQYVEGHSQFVNQHENAHSAHHHTVPSSKRLLSHHAVQQLQAGQSPQDRWDTVEPSLHAQNTINPIRRIVDVMNIEPNPEKPLLKLHIGDPTITGILPTHPKVLQAVAETLQTGKYNGYGPAIGFPEVRKELATFLNEYGGGDSECKIEADDIILTSGCSHALQLAIEALGGPGKNILVPRPGKRIAYFC